MKDEALKLALEALDWISQVNAMDYEYREKAQTAITAIKQALVAPVQKGAIGAEYQKSPWDEKGISMPPPEAPVQEPVAGQPLPCPFCGHIGLDFSDGETYRWGVASCGGCGASCGDVRREYPDQGEWHTEAIAEWNRRSPAAPDLQSELDATNRQVEILSDALAESRRSINALVALARADEREACAKVCDDIDVEYEGEDVLATWCSRAIRARGETK
jgi:hypothetical protein